MDPMLISSEGTKTINFAATPMGCPWAKKVWACSHRKQVEDCGRCSKPPTATWIERRGVPPGAGRHM
jgi:hypothetical protein